MSSSARSSFDPPVPASAARPVWQLGRAATPADLPLCGLDELAGSGLGHAQPDSETPIPEPFNLPDDQGVPGPFSGHAVGEASGLVGDAAGSLELDQRISTSGQRDGDGYVRGGPRRYRLLDALTVLFRGHTRQDIADPVSGGARSRPYAPTEAGCWACRPGGLSAGPMCLPCQRRAARTYLAEAQITQHPEHPIWFARRHSPLSATDRDATILLAHLAAEQVRRDAQRGAS